MPPFLKAFLLPERVLSWLKYQFIPALGLEPRKLTLGVLKGTFDTLLIILLGLSFTTGGRIYMDGQYALPRTTQNVVLKWAPVANRIARRIDIPREVPLVLWFKESSMQAINPESCTGIMGVYDLVRSGEVDCFTPGPISDIEIGHQLAIGAIEYKKRCPDITYWSQNQDEIKRCYLAYNAGMGAADKLNPDDSAYVMNNFDEHHTNMVYSDIELGTVRMQSNGAWPAHLAMQSLIVSQADRELEERPLPFALGDASTRFYDWGIHLLNRIQKTVFENSELNFPTSRDGQQMACLQEPHLLGNPRLRPRLNPVTHTPLLTQDVHGCSYNLPGLDITSSNTHAVLQAPMPGNVTTFTDRWYNSTIRIENDEWIVWLLHPRSYRIKEGAVKRGESVGVMGAVGNATGPHVHYTIYDKTKEGFVDPRHFIP